MTSIHLVFPVLPPSLDGIGDYTAQLAETLSKRCQVKVLTGEGAFDPIRGVEVEQAFSIQKPSYVCSLSDAVRRDAPDWLVLQYNPFSYGKRGFSPYLPLVLRRVRRDCPLTRIAVMVHEPFVPAVDWRSTAMTSWQRWQLWTLGRGADAIFFSIEPWVRAFERWFGGTPVFHLPVGSNMPRVPLRRGAARARLGLSEDALIVGVFGSAHPSRLLSFIKAATQALREGGRTFQVLYVGACGATLREALGAVPIIDAGPLPPEEVSSCFTAMDLYLAPFRKGVSSRRGSFMVGLQHGVPTISTYGVQTDDMLRLQDGRAFCLVRDDDPSAFGACVLQFARDKQSRVQMGRVGRRFFETAFSWERISDTLLTVLGRFEAGFSVDGTALANAAATAEKVEA
ncbi:MAG TPA: glycosyltransferase family 4 protein [Rhodothermales bacterium]|nr:glycosyltransferase family 4 protein [Rhodothermales bacterium]